jgi:hypothetical protein
VDLIYGLPLQTPETFEKTVERVIDMDVDRVACYSFAFVPWIRGHQKKLDEGELPSKETKMELFAIAREKLLGAGYQTIGMDHFAKPGDELARAKSEGRLRRNFQGYAVIPGDDVLAFGISAIGDVRGAMFQNEKKLSRYRDMVEAGRLPAVRGVVRNRDDEIRADVIHRLMCNRHRRRGYREPLGRRLRDYFASGPSFALTRRKTRSHWRRVHPRHSRRRALRSQPRHGFDRYMREKHAAEAKPVSAARFDRTVKRLVVIGGGISGTAGRSPRRSAAEIGARARRCSRKRAGGRKALSEAEDGWPSRRALGYLGSEPIVDELARDAGLEGEIVRAGEAQSHRFVFARGKPREVKPSPVGFAASGLLSLGGLLRVAREPWIPGKIDDRDESVWDFAARRLGAEFADRLIHPMVLGIFAGDAKRLSLPAAFPVMAELEREHGSLIRADRPSPKEQGPRGSVLSFRNGMQAPARTRRPRRLHGADELLGSRGRARRWLPHRARGRRSALRRRRHSCLRELPDGGASFGSCSRGLS